MKKLKFFTGLILISIIPYSVYTQNSENMESQRTAPNNQTKFQEAISESNNSYSYSCSFGETHYQEIKKIIESSFDELQLENENFYYKIQLSKNSLNVDFNSTDMKKNEEAQNVLSKFKKIEKQISVILN